MASEINAILNRVAKVTRQTAENLKTELRQIEAERTRLTAGLDNAASRIRDTLNKLGTYTGSGANGHAAPKQARTRKGKRVRRSPEQLKHEAEAIWQFIKDKGSAGAKGGDIRKRHPKVGPDIKGFVAKFGGHKLKTAGQKAGMRYVAT